MQMKSVIIKYLVLFKRIKWLTGFGDCNISLWNVSITKASLIKTDLKRFYFARVS